MKARDDLVLLLLLIIGTAAGTLIAIYVSYVVASKQISASANSNPLLKLLSGG